MIPTAPGRALVLRSFIAAAIAAALAVAAATAHAGDPPARPDAATAAAPAKPTRRSHLQPVGEIVAAPQTSTELGMRLTRASAVLRQQLALTRGAGLVVDDITPESRAAKAGFKQHDVLVMLDDQLLLLPEQLNALLESAPADAPMHCIVLRGGRKVTIPLDAAAPPARRELAAGLRPAASTLALVQQRTATATRPAAVSQRAPETAAPGRLTRVSHETLLRHDADYQIRLTNGDETRLVVTDSVGRVVFNDAIDTPEGRSRMPVAVRNRVEEMERSLEQPPATASRPDTAIGRPTTEIGRLDVEPVVIR